MGWWPCPECCQEEALETCIRCLNDEAPPFLRVTIAGIVNGANSGCTFMNGDNIYLNFTGEDFEGCCHWTCAGAEDPGATLRPYLVSQYGVGSSLSVTLCPGDITNPTDYVLLGSLVLAGGDSVAFRLVLGPISGAKPDCTAWSNLSIPNDGATGAFDCDASAATMNITSYNFARATCEECVPRGPCDDWDDHPTQVQVVLAGMENSVKTFPAQCDGPTCAGLNGTYVLDCVAIVDPAAVAFVMAFQVAIVPSVCGYSWLTMWPNDGSLGVNDWHVFISTAQPTSFPTMPGDALQFGSLDTSCTWANVAFALENDTTLGFAGCDGGIGGGSPATASVTKLAGFPA